jgi:methylmalonyl-CoA/ethylmalonyl-CoA epimerase
MTSGARPSAAALSVTGIGLTHVDHVGIAVSDLDEAIEFYQRVFGLRCVHQETSEEQGVREAVLTADPAHAAPGAGGRAYLQLLAPLSPDSTIATFIRRSGPGLQQVALGVVDIDVACAVLRERGVRVLYDTPRRGTAGSRINFVHPKDAGGVLVELVQHPTPDP